MLIIAAGRIVASVKDLSSFRDGPMLELVGQPMSVELLSSDFYPAIPKAVSLPHPFHATKRWIANKI